MQEAQVGMLPVFGLMAAILSIICSTSGNVALNNGICSTAKFEKSLGKICPPTDLGCSAKAILLSPILDLNSRMKVYICVLG